MPRVPHLLAVVLAATAALVATATAGASPLPGAGAPPRAEPARAALASLEVDVPSALAGEAARISLEQLHAAGEQLAAGEPCAAARTLNETREASKPSGSRELLDEIAAAQAELVAADGASACGIPAPTFAVDASVKPAALDLRAPDGALRPTARIVDAYGRGTDFVTNELVVLTDSRAELSEILARWRGRVLDTVTRTTPDTHLVRIDPSQADVASLAADLRAADPLASGAYAVSSDAGLQLLAGMAAENAAGHAVELNVVAEPHTFVDGSQEHPTSANSQAYPDYDQDAGSWPNMRTGPEQDIGVLAAWRVLEFAGVLDAGGASKKIAIIDGGYAQDQDWPAGTYLPPGEGWYPGKPWHGTAVAQAVGAVADNEYGTAGSAGPIANLMLIQHDGTMWGSVDAIMNSWAQGARIINMSYGAYYPAVLTSIPTAWDNATIAARAGGVLIFASAGNEGIDVDAEDCFLVCWEEGWHAPCENNGVICVGGIAEDSKWRHELSNYGYEWCGQAPCDVDFFGPMTVWAGATPADSDGTARTAPWKASGSSVASPFVAGVAALIWAAGPTLDADDVESLLLSTAHSSPDSKVARYVNAYDPVKQVLGDLPPQIEIIEPTETDIPFGGLNIVHFEAHARDYEDGDPCCTIAWTSDADGPLGFGASLDLTFDSPGTRTVTATATDSEGETATATLELTIGNTPPTAQIGPLPNGGIIYRNVPYQFSGTGQDVNEPLLTLSCSALKWQAARPGDQVAVNGSGCDPTLTFPATGQWTITLTATDPEGAKGTDSEVVFVIDPPSQGAAPAVSIIQPTQNAVLNPNTNRLLSAVATDPDGDPMTYRWEVKIGSSAPKLIGTAKVILWKPSSIVPGSCGLKPVKLFFTATDADGMSDSDTRSVSIAFPNC